MGIKIPYIIIIIIFIRTDSHAQNKGGRRSEASTGNHALTQGNAWEIAEGFA